MNLDFLTITENKALFREQVARANHQLPVQSYQGPTIQ